MQRAWPAIPVGWRTRKGRDRDEVPVGELWPSAKSGLLPILYSQGALQILHF